MPYQVSYVNLLFPKGRFYYKQLYTLSTLLAHQNAEVNCRIPTTAGQRAHRRLLLQEETEHITCFISQVPAIGTLSATPQGCTERSLSPMQGKQTEKIHSMVLSSVPEVVLPHRQSNN